MTVYKFLVIVLFAAFLGTLPPGGFIRGDEDATTPKDDLGKNQGTEKTWPKGFAFEQLKKIKEAGLDTIYYAVFDRYRLIGWVKVQYDLVAQDNKPIVAVRLVGEMRDRQYGENYAEAIAYYDADLNIQGFTASNRRKHNDTIESTTIRVVREGEVLKIEMENGKQIQKGEVRLVKLSESPVWPFAFALKYAGRGVPEKGGIAVMDEMAMSLSRQGMAEIVGRVPVLTDMGDNLIQAEVMTPPWRDSYVVEATTGVLVMRKYTMGIQMLISRETYDEWIKGFKWLEAEQGIARNVANLLPQPARPVAEWKGKREELAKYWKQRVDKMDAKTLQGAKETLSVLSKRRTREISKETEEQIRQCGVCLLDYAFSETFNNAENSMAIVSLVYVIPTLGTEISGKIRDSLVALLYEESPSIQDYILGLLVEKCWDDSLEDICLERLRNSRNPLLLDSICKLIHKKEPPWFPVLCVYGLTNENLRYGCDIPLWMRDGISKPLFIGLSLERWNLGAGSYGGDVTLKTLQKVFGDGLTLQANLSPFYYNWCKAVFGCQDLRDVREKALLLMEQLNSEEYETRKKARGALVEMGEAVLPLLEEQREHKSLEVRAAFRVIADEIVAPGYWDVMDFVRDKHYDRNLEMFIGFLACQTPRLRENAYAKLKALTGEDFGQDFAKWYRWYEINRKNLKWNEEKQRYEISE